MHWEGTQVHVQSYNHKIVRLLTSVSKIQPQFQLVLTSIPMGGLTFFNI